MFSIKSSKLKIALTAFAAVLAVAAVVLLINRGKPAVSDNAISLKASNASERAAFLSQFGWDIEEDPVEVAEVIIPAEFDRGYEKYNLFALCIERNQKFLIRIKDVNSNGILSTMNLEDTEFDIDITRENRTGIIQILI